MGEAAQEVVTSPPGAGVVARPQFQLPERTHFCLCYTFATPSAWSRVVGDYVTPPEIPRFSIHQRLPTQKTKGIPPRVPRPTGAAELGYGGKNCLDPIYSIRNATMKGGRATRIVPMCYEPGERASRLESRGNRRAL